MDVKLICQIVGAALRDLKMKTKVKVLMHHQRMNLQAPRISEKEFVLQLCTLTCSLPVYIEKKENLQLIMQVNMI
jgi:hypothetical protein